MICAEPVAQLVKGSIPEPTYTVCPNTLVAQSSLAAALWKPPPEPVHPILVNRHFCTSAPRWTLQTVYI